MPGNGFQHHLVLIRHAKSRYPYGVPDHERPLSGKGLRNAQAAAHWLAEEGPPINLVLCSDATRARQTWQVIAPELKRPPKLRIDRQLYLASVADLLAVVGAIDDSVHSIAVVGHEPTMSNTVLQLAAPGSDPQALRAVTTKYPTNGIAVLAVNTQWHALGGHSTVLERFVVPRA